jgi:hypothetical protein
MLPATCCRILARSSERGSETRRHLLVAAALKMLFAIGQMSDAHAGEHRGIFADERGQLRMRRFELFNGLF